jgi:hypothetical protein
MNKIQVGDTIHAFALKDQNVLILIFPLCPPGKNWLNL